MPSITIGNNTGDTYSGTEDAWLRQYQNTYNYGGWSEMNVQRYASGNHSTSCLKFSGISSIPTGATITAASIFIYKHNGTSDNNTITVKRLLRNWVEGTSEGTDRVLETPHSCCWDEYGNDQPWTSGGALSDGNDRDSTTSATTVVSSTGRYYEFTSAQIISDVQAFLSGTYSNYGWVLERTDGTNDNTYNSFRTSEGTDGQRPYLSVTYTTGGMANNYYYQMQM